MDSELIEEVLFFKGIGNSGLARGMMRKLHEYMGTQLPIGHINHRRFADSELDDGYPEYERVEGKTVVFFECLKKEDITFRFLQLCWALKHQYGAKHIVAVLSFLHYRRQEQVDKKEEINRNRMLIEMMAFCGVDHMILATPHSSQIAKNCEKCGIIFRSADASETFVSTLRPLLPELGDGKIVKVYAPDEGSIPRAIEVARRLGVGVLFNLKDRDFSNETAMIDADHEMIDRIKQKYQYPDLNHATPESIQGAIVVMVEDEIDTCGTANRQGVLLRKYGAERIYFCVTHAVCSDGWKRKLFANDPFTKVIVCDTIYRGDEQRTGGKMHDVSMAGPLAAELYRMLQKLL